MPTTTRERTRAREAQAALEPKNAELAINLAEAWLREGRLEEAVQAYARASELDPRTEFRSLYLEWLGQVREARGELEQALEAYDSWAQAEPWSVEPVDRAGALLVALQRWTDLALLRNQYGQRAEGNAQGRVLESQALFSYLLEQLGSTEDPPPLQRTYAALEVDSRSIAMRYLLGTLFFRTGHLEAAAAEFHRVLELDSDRTWVERRFSLGWRASSAWLMLGRIARLQGRIPEALDHFQSCLQTAEDPLEALEELTSFLVELGYYQEALDLLPEEEEVPPWVARLRARCCLGLGRVDEAASLLAAEPATGDLPTEEPAGPPALLQAERDLLAGRAAEALKAFSKLRRSAGWRARWGMARAAAALDRWSEAARHLEDLLREQPDQVEAWALLADAYRRTGRKVRRRLALLQHEALAAGPVEGHEGFLAPAEPGSSASGLSVSARAVPGEGVLTVTGEPGAEAPAMVVWTFLQAEAVALGLPDPDSRNVHVHVRALERAPEEGPWPAETRSPAGEEVGLAVLGAVAAALHGWRPAGRVALAGRVDLEGGLWGSGALTAGLLKLLEAGYGWDRLVLPRAMAAEIHRLPEEVWTSADMVLCATGAQALRALFEEASG